MKATTGRTLAKLRTANILCDKVEQWLAPPKGQQHGRRRDLFGFIDIVAIENGAIVGIQTTSDREVARHRDKIIDECRHAAMEWLRAGGLIQIWGWSKPKHRWTVRVVAVTIEDFPRMVPRPVVGPEFDS